MGALAITHNPRYRDPFAPLPGDVVFVPYGDAEALAAAVDGETAAVVLEPIQGENGIVVPPAGYLARAREICDTHGALLWLDEVQTGMGRTGSWFVHVDQGVRADVVTLAKGLGNGFPIGACLAVGRAAQLLGPGSHGSTFGGNPVAAIAGLAVIAVIERDGLLARATELGEHLVSSITALDHPLITGVRGRGLLRGVTLNQPVAAGVADAALDAGFIINAPRPDVLRLAPPLIITAEQLDGFVGPAARAAGRRRRGSPAMRHFLADDDLSPAEQADVLGAGGGAQGEPVRSQAVRRSALGSGAVRQADPADAELVRRRHRRARRLPDDRRRAARRDRRPRVGGGHGAGARPTGGRHRLADLRAVGPGGDGGALRRAGGERADRQLPPVPDPGGPADGAGAFRPAGRSAVRLRR